MWPATSTSNNRAREKKTSTTQTWRNRTIWPMMKKSDAVNWRTTYKTIECIQYKVVVWKGSWLVIMKPEACFAFGGTEGDDAAVGDGTLYKESLSVDKRYVIGHVNNRFCTIFHRLFQCAMVEAFGSWDHCCPVCEKKELTARINHLCLGGIKQKVNFLYRLQQFRCVFHSPIQWIPFHSPHTIAIAITASILSWSENVLPLHSLVDICFNCVSKNYQWEGSSAVHFV